ncbi:integrase family protein [Micromonospora aurantiaca ATCC 27029]|nr:integrase family protein [Micromonospora aurantiaca ATCC 27029]
MTASGVIFKRCGCRDDQRRRLEQSCPRLGERGHGTWYFHCSATNLIGRKERVRRGGYPSQAAARRARDGWLTTTEADRTAQGWTVERWLRHWLDNRTKFRPTTRFHYTRDVDIVLIPHLGRYRLADLDAPPFLRAVFAEIAATRNSKGRPQSASAMHHLRTTLRAALNLAVKEGILDCNPARHIEITGYQQPHARVWTDARVESWEQTGARPAVAVWTADQLAEFLGAVNDDPLFALWWLAGLRGLRRGELCGLRWSDIDLDRGILTIERNRTTAGYQIVEGQPKTPAGRRTVALDKRSVQILRVHRRYEQDRKGGGGGERHAVDRQRIRVHPLRRQSDQSELRHYPLSDPRTPGRAAPGAAARPAPRRRVPRPRSRSRPEDPAGSPRALQHRGHRRHLHQRPAADPASLRRRYRPTGAQRRTPHPEEDQSQRPQEPARPRSQSQHPRSDETENKCSDPSETQAGRKAAGHVPTNPREGRFRTCTHIAPT